jgi:hypothetical protein
MNISEGLDGVLPPAGGTIAAMLEIAKLTPVYDPVQDRLRLNVQTRQGPVVVMWLTQRLSTLIVQNLARQLDEGVKAEKLTPNRTPVHRFEQGAAVARHKAQPAVRTEQATDSGLVHRIDITRQPGRFVLTWVADGETSARMAVDDMQLRQLLEIFRRVYVKAEWSVLGWPAWLQEPAVAVSTPDTPTSLH